jgi:hypothetical protein
VVAIEQTEDEHGGVGKGKVCPYCIWYGTKCLTCHIRKAGGL